MLVDVDEFDTTIPNPSEQEERSKVETAVQYCILAYCIRIANNRPNRSIACNRIFQPIDLILESTSFVNLFYTKTSESKRNIYKNLLSFFPWLP